MKRTANIMVTVVHCCQESLGETISAANVKKALVKFLAIFRAKRFRMASQDWIL